MGGRQSRGGGAVGGMRIHNAGDRRHGQMPSGGRGGRRQAVRAAADVGGPETGGMSVSVWAEEAVCASGKPPPCIKL